MSRADLAWRDHAACVGRLAVMFPDAEGSRAVDYSAAKAVCATCPVTEQCLEYALSGEHGLYGCWAGTSPRDRRIMRRHRNLGVVRELDITQLALDM